MNKRKAGWVGQGRKRAMADKLRYHYERHMKLRRQINANAKPGRYTRPQHEVVLPGPSEKTVNRNAG